MMATELLIGMENPFVLWQIIPLILIIGLIVFWVLYRRRQM